MKLSPKAAKVLKRLLLKDALSRIRQRLKYWAASCILLYSFLLFASFFIAYPPVLFYALLMAAGSFFPAFLFWPDRGEPFLKLVSRVDEHMALESWLEYRQGPLSHLVSSRAEEVLRGKADFYSAKQKPDAFLRLVLLLSLAAFASGQFLSLKKGMGYSFVPGSRTGIKDALLAEKSDKGFLAENEDKGHLPAPESGQSIKLYNNDALGLERSEARARLLDRFFANPLRDLQEKMLPRQSANAAGQGAEQTAGQSPGALAAASKEEQGDKDPGSPGSQSESGYEGSSKALVADPIPSYLAQFERIYTDKTGDSAALAEKGNPDAFMEALATYFASFDLKLKLGNRLEPELQEIIQLWQNLGLEANR